jgi:hypothetical protein
MLEVSNAFTANLQSQLHIQQERHHMSLQDTQTKSEGGLKQKERQEQEILNMQLEESLVTQYALSSKLHETERALKVQRESYAELSQKQQFSWYASDSNDSDSVEFALLQVEVQKLTSPKNPRITLRPQA